MAINPEDIIDPIRYYKPNDPYYYEVDNLPLEDLLENDRRLLQAITSIVASIPFDFLEGDRFATERWVSKVAAGPWTFRKLEDLSDVSTDDPTPDQVLTYSTAGWQPQTPVVSLEGLSDTDLEGTVAGDLMQFNGTSWVNIPFGDVPLKGELVRVATVPFNKTFRQLRDNDILFGDVPVGGAGDFKITLDDYWVFDFDRGNASWNPYRWHNHEFLTIYAVLSPNLILHPNVGDQTTDWSLYFWGSGGTGSMQDLKYRYSRQTSSMVNRSPAKLRFWTEGTAAGSMSSTRWLFHFNYADQSQQVTNVRHTQMILGDVEWFGDYAMNLWVRKTDNEPASVKFYVGMNYTDSQNHDISQKMNNRPNYSLTNYPDVSNYNESASNIGIVSCTPVSNI